jgi:hypothetical protein
MSTHIRMLSLFGLLLVSGAFAGAIAWLSPNPLPMPHTQLLTACIALFSASGYALLRLLSNTGSKQKEAPKTIDANHAPSIEGPDPETFPSPKVKQSYHRPHI